VLETVFNETAGARVCFQEDGRLKERNLINPHEQCRVSKRRDPCRYDTIKIYSSVLAFVTTNGDTIAEDFRFLLVRCNFEILNQDTTAITANGENTSFQHYEKPYPWL
jgi:hypothetical protein